MSARVKVMNNPEFENLECFPPGHFYSALPSLEDRKEFLASKPTENDLLGIKLNGQKQFELLKKFKEYYDQCPFQDEKSGNLRYYFQNPSYSYTDGLILYCMIREFKPKRIIEVGSGYSSCLMLDTSELYFDDQIDFTFIEPYPELLYSLVKESDRKHKILPVKVQEADINIFKALEANDILFIDSTHVSKLRSDVNKIIHEDQLLWEQFCSDYGFVYQGTPAYCLEVTTPETAKRLLLQPGSTFLSRSLLYINGLFIII
ncbi:MAG: hypothetical protein AB1480_00545 [Nitrospirota bacterium]